MPDGSNSVFLKFLIILMKTELISKLEELLTKEAGDVANEVRALQKEYQKLWTLEFEKAKQTFVEEGGKAKEFEYPKQPEDARFESLMDKFAKLKKENEAKLAADQAKNLLIRQEIISKIKDLSKLSDNVGAAIKKLQELQTQWKETGPVSSHKYKEIQAEYSKATEDFYYNLKIYRDLQEHDLKRNFENKTELIEKLKAVKNIDNIKEAERLIKVYRNEWDEIGPVPNEKWDETKQSYKAALDDVYAKIKTHYNGIEEKKENSLQFKLGLIEKAKELIASMEGAGIKKWNDTTEKLIALQAEWKTGGRTSEKDNEKTWAEFRTLCDSFFEKKKEFFATMNEKFAASRKFKNELIAKAEALQNSTDWQKTGLALIKLQDEWKKHPGNGDKEEPHLFQKFRKACNAFFDAKKAHFEGVDASFEDNLKVKEEILAKLNTYTEATGREELKAIASEWNNAGMVPMKDKKRMNDAFYAKLDELYEKMNINKEEKATIQFKTKVERMAGSENAFDQLRKESEYLKKISDEINNNIRTYENNLGFFKHSKGSPLMKEFENKIEIEKAKLAELKAKREIVTEELNKIREATKSTA
ncbi:MAG: hypothetical protein JWO32_2983 [Bacteroidetes bacterium]|nr:hypothetical protein [Bacteroidota bacterium]